MKNEIIIDNIKFWINQNIIYCKIDNDFKSDSIGVELEEIFSNAIQALSKGKYKPILINMTDVNFLLSIKLFRYLSNNVLIKTLVLSKTFLVNSFGLKILLFIYSLTTDPIVPNKVFKYNSLAIKHCNKKYMEFNVIG